MSITEIQNKYGLAFHPEKIVPYKVAISLKSKILIDENQEVSNKSTDGVIDASTLELGLSIQERTENAKAELKIRLINIFFEVAENEVENWDIEKVEDVFDCIREEKPTLVESLKMKSKTKIQNTYPASLS